MKKEYIIPIFVPHLGCPNSCTFCNQHRISGVGLRSSSEIVTMGKDNNLSAIGGQQNQVTGKDVKDTIEYYLKSFKDDNKYVEVAFFGGSFTAIDTQLQEELLSVANEYIKNGKVKSIRISTRPDYINKDILKMLKKYNVKTIELGVQSTNNYILAKCKRGHTYEDVEKASKLIRWNRFILGHQMMVGLPESTELDEVNTAKQLIKLKPKIVRIYPVLVIKGTQLEEEYKKGEYTPLTVNQAVERCKEIFNLFNRKKINVIRIGLQNTEEIADPSCDKSEVVAGPYHPAFRQLVESSMWYDAIVGKIKQFNVKVMRAKIIANPENINNIIGHKKENIFKLKDLYDVDIEVEANEEIKLGKFNIEILKAYSDFLEK